MKRRTLLVGVMLVAGVKMALAQVKFFFPNGDGNAILQEADLSPLLEETAVAPWTDWLLEENNNPE